MHALPVRQRALKLSHYYPNIYSKINDTSSSMPIEDGTQIDRQKTPNLGSIFLPNIGHCSYATTRHLCHISTKKCNESLHSTIQIRDLYLSCKSSFGLPSINMPKGQLSNKLMYIYTCYIFLALLDS